MITNRYIVVAGLFIGCGGGNSTSPQPAEIPPPPKIKVDPDKSIKAFIGPEGLRVAIVPFVSTGPANYLLHVLGSDSPADKMVWPVEQIDRNNDKAYRTTLHGEYRWLLWQEVNRHSAQWKIRIPKDSEFETWDKPTLVEFAETEVAKTNTSAIIARYTELTDDGTLEKLQAWNRPQRESRIQAELDQVVAKTNDACGSNMSAPIDWQSIDDEKLKTLSIASYCDSGLNALERACRRFADAGEQVVDIAAFSCSFDGTAGVSTAGDTQLSWVPGQTNNDQRAWGEIQKLLGKELLVAKSENGIYIAVDSSEKKPKYYYGDGVNFHRQRMHFSYGGGNGGGLFSPGVISKLNIKNENWILECGEQNTEFVELSTRDTKKIASKAKFEDVQFDREPLLLARDTRGTYYYVDRLIEDKGGKDFRVFVGRKGAAKQTRLKDIVDDSDGQVFATRKGELRLVVDRGQAQSAVWIRKKKKKKLKVLNTADNSSLIYQELGPYEGVNLGSVCLEPQ